MNTKSLTLRLIAAATFAFAGSAAMADDITIVADTFVPQLTRAEVQAEVLAAKANGTLTKDDESASAMSQGPAMSSLTRDDVRAELLNSPRMRAVTFNPAA